MITPKQLINILRDDFSLSLKDEKIIFLLNSLEKKLKKHGVIEKEQVFNLDNLSTQALSLGDENVEIYLYHILSKEAVLQSDIARFNTFSMLYNSALQNLFSEKNSKKTSFKNIW